jgi:hypothetical protein
MSDLSRYRLPSPLEGFFRDRKMAAPMSSVCAFCGASFTGTALEVIANARAHQQAAHPNAVDRGQNARRIAARNAAPSVWVPGRAKAQAEL